ncbi:MAG: type II secretion system F family protein [Candidatus Doudnabacteria bacterium]|nr:type II secretion system F family protein [Candidatus Doudnabacteria bacterium]
MSSYRYQAKDKSGGLVVGTVEAANEAQAAETLESHNLVPIRFSELTALSSLDAILSQLSRVTGKDMVIFFRQLATLVNAQVRIVTALKILTKQVSSRKFRSLIEDLASEVEGGKSFSEGLSIYPNLFPDLYTSLIRAGEASGTLDKSLLYLADQIEKDYDLRAKIRGALYYPAFIVAVLIIVGVLMMIFVLPQLTAVLQESGAELPLATKIIIATSNLMRGFWYILLAGLLGLIFLVRYLIRTTSGRYFYDNLLIHTPLIGPFLQKIYLYRFAHHMANLLSGGISIVKALQLIADIIGNWTYRDIFLEAASEVQTGRSLREVLESYPEIPPLVYQMAEVGQQTGDLQGILRKLSNFYEKEVENYIANLTTLIEPIIMVLLGVAVSIVVAGILLPIYNLASSF